VNEWLQPEVWEPKFQHSTSFRIIIQSIQSASPSQQHNTSDEIHVLNASSTHEFSFVCIYLLNLSFKTSHILILIQRHFLHVPKSGRNIYKLKMCRGNKLHCYILHDWLRTEERATGTRYTKRNETDLHTKYTPVVTLLGLHRSEI